MIKTLSVQGLGQVKDLEELVRLAAENGFEAVETNGSELKKFVHEKGTEGAKAFLRKEKVQIGSFGLPVQWRTSDEEFKRGLSNLIEDAAIFSQFGCTTCYTYILPSVDENVFSFTLKATKRLKLCAQILREYGIHLGLEFVGPHHLRTKWKHPFIWKMEDTLDWIDFIHEENIGLLLDSFHWFTTEGTVDDILSLEASQITYVHLNDARDVPVTEILDNDRLYPGEGVIPLVDFLQALKKINYKGMVAQEILTPTPPTDSCEELAQRSGMAFQKLFKAADLSRRD